MSDHPRIVTDPRIMVGKPVVRGTRITVEFILKLLAGGWTVADVLDNYPHLTDADVRAALAFAAEYMEKEVVLAAE